MNSKSKKSKTPFVLVIEGVDFSGKTTLANRIQTVLASHDYRVKLLHDPKGSENSKVIWKTILKIKAQDSDPTTELFLFLAARNELICKELLKYEVDVVIFDRFIFSTIAYQLTHRLASWDPFLATHRYFLGIMPDLCVYCDIDFYTFQHRRQKRSQKDHFDEMTQNRFEAVRIAYEQVLKLQLCPSMTFENTANAFPKLIDHIMGCIDASIPC